MDPLKRQFDIPPEKNLSSVTNFPEITEYFLYISFFFKFLLVFQRILPLPASKCFQTQLKLH